MSDELLELERGTGSAKRIIVVFRSDLPEMTRAKGEVQFGHAVAGVLHEAGWAAFTEYVADNQPKICMEADSLDDLRAMQAKAAKRGVPSFMVTDAAHTVFAEPTTTCLGIGPMSKTDGNSITRGARMRQ